VVYACIAVECADQERSPGLSSFASGSQRRRPNGSLSSGIICTSVSALSLPASRRFLTSHRDRNGFTPGYRSEWQAAVHGVVDSGS